MSKSPSGIQVDSPLQRTWMTFCSNGSSFENASHVFGARSSWSRARKLYGPAVIDSAVMNPPFRLRGSSPDELQESHRHIDRGLDVVERHRLGRVVADATGAADEQHRGSGDRRQHGGVVTAAARQPNDPPTGV